MEVHLLGRRSVDVRLRLGHRAEDPHRKVLLSGRQRAGPFDDGRHVGQMAVRVLFRVLDPDVFRTKAGFDDVVDVQRDAGQSK